MTLFAIIASILLPFQKDAPAAVFDTGDAVVWNHQQRIDGKISSGIDEVGACHNGDCFEVEVNAEGEFSFELELTEPENRIWITGMNSDALSDTLQLSLGYRPVPLMEPYAFIQGDVAELQAKLIDNPYGRELELKWFPDTLNPMPTQIATGSRTTVEIPKAVGEYFYNLLVVAEEDSVWYQTMVRREGDSLKAFDIAENSPPSWMDEAIIYQITPHAFVEDGTFKDITAKLPEIKSLGVNTIYLQPVYGTANGNQGYDITNYLALNPEFGTEEDLKALIKEARSLNLRVLFDIVLNHSSIKHPYAKDRIANGKNSHYYNFYQSEDDGKPYSSFYNWDEYRFINYFWPELVNLNYNHPEVQRWMLEAAKKWVRDFDIDGYRLDAIWGVNSRNPEFAGKLRRELKSIKPDVLLLAEGKGSNPKVYELGYDAAYDWTADTTWVSQTSWETEYVERAPKTIFNHPKVEERGDLLRQAMFGNGENAYRKLFYLENNDLASFLSDYGLERTKMAAAWLFSLPGIPMLYNGQEIGFKGHPYRTKVYFERDSSIESLDQYGLYDYYKKLISLHQQYPALYAGEMEEVAVSPDASLVAYHRWQGEQHFLVLVNLSDTEQQAIPEFTGSKRSPRLEKTKNYVLDIITGEAFKLGENSRLKIPMQTYSTRWLLLEPEKQK